MICPRGHGRGRRATTASGSGSGSGSGSASASASASGKLLKVEASLRLRGGRSDMRREEGERDRGA